MGDTDGLEYNISEDTLKLLFEASNSSNVEKSLEILVENSKSAVWRSDLASKRVLPAVLEIIHLVPHTSQHHHLLSLSFKLLRNLCAGEIANQNSFVKLKGAGIVSNIFRWVAGSSVPDLGLVRVGLQVLANVSLAGKEHQHAIWEELYPYGFVSLARFRSKETCDPLCMIIYTCHGNPELVKKLFSDNGWPIIAEIIRTASFVGFGEDWLRLLLSKVCLEESQLPLLFSQLWFGADPGREATEFRDDQFSSEQAFLLQILAEILNEHISNINVTRDVALYVFETFKMSMGVLKYSVRAKSGIPTGSAAIDVLGYSLNILRDICAQDSARGGSKGDAEDVVDVLLTNALIEMLLSLLHDLEPPAIIKKAVKQTENQDEVAGLSKPCPYKGFRRDIVALIGNCVYRRKHAQDEIRRKNGILLLLQQCVTDEDNPYLREWGIWSVRNMLEGNDENQRVVSELEVQGPVDVPEIAALGLRVEVDQNTRRAKLVNVPSKITIN